MAIPPLQYSFFRSSRRARESGHLKSTPFTPLPCGDVEKRAAKWSSGSSPRKDVFRARGGKFAEGKYFIVGAERLGGVERGPDFWLNVTCGPSWS